jgi:hypothetical protein
MLKANDVDDAYPLCHIYGTLFRNVCAWAIKDAAGW